MMKAGIFLMMCMVMVNSFAQPVNRLTKEEERQGWRLLFDGASATGWRNFKSNTIGAAWKVQDGALMLDTSDKAAKGGDIITDEEFEDFELALEWKISNCGNSGVMFNVVEQDDYDYVWRTGPEMQVLDNTCHPDAKIHKHRAGDLYDLIACAQETVKPAGEWNQVRITSKKGYYEFFLNGSKVISFTMHTPEWDALVQGSKFKNMPAFGKARKGHIALQDHGDPVWFRNIKIRKL